MSVPRFRLPFSLLAAAALLSGCSTYEDKSKAVVQDFHAGDYAGAAIAAKAGLEDAHSRDKLVWKLEYAASERAAGHWEQGLKAFDDAESDLRKWDEAPPISITSESAATLVNLTYLPYRGTGYDRIMAATYRAMCALALNRIDDARVYLNQAYYRQDEVRKLAQKDVEAARADAADASGSADVSRTQGDAGTQEKLSNLYGDLKSYRLYGDYVNPFTAWLRGVFRMATSEGGADIEIAHKDLEQVSVLVPGNPVVKADLATAEKMRDGAPLPPTVWVVFETGMGPHLKEERIDIPLFIVSPTVPYVGIALPKLVFNSGFTSGLNIEYAGKAVARTETVASMDAVVATDFDNGKTEIVTRSIITAGIKAAAQYAANKAAETYMQKEGGAAGALVYIGSMVATGAATYATTEADLRVWRTLPKAFQIARLDPPADGKLRLVGSGPAQVADITLPPGSAFLIMAKATDAGTPLIYSVTTLRGPVPGAKPIAGNVEVIPAAGRTPQGATP